MPRSNSQHISCSRQQGLLTAPKERIPSHVLSPNAESVKRPVNRGESINSRLAELNEAQGFCREDFSASS